MIDSAAMRRRAEAWLAPSTTRDTAINEDQMALDVIDLLAEVERLRGKLDDVTNGDFEAWCDKLVASRVANAQHAYDRVVAARDNARANARILAHSYTHDSRPPQRAVDEALAYPATGTDPMTDAEVYREVNLDLLVAELKRDVRHALSLCQQHEDFPFGGNHSENERHQREVDVLNKKYFGDEE